MLISSKINHFRSRFDSVSVARAIAERSLQPFARSIRFGLLALLPYFMLSTVVQILLAAAASLAPGRLFFIYASALASLMQEVMPLAIWGCMGSVRAIRLQLPRSAIVASCIGFGLIFQVVTKVDGGWAATLLVPIAIFGPLAAVPLIDFLRDQRFCRIITRETTAGEAVSEAINLIVPVLLTALVVFAAACLVVEATAFFDANFHPHASTSPLVVAIQYCIFNSLLWAFGVHGYYALMPLLNHFQSLTAHSADLNLNIFGLFVFIGGSGATFSLALATMIWSRSEKRRVLACASLVPGFFNVNELILFGLPVILNLRLLTPFVLTPLVNLAIASVLVRYQVIHLSPVLLPFNAPMVFNAWLCASPGLGAVGVQLLLVVVDTLIYMPFVKMWDRQRITDLARQLPISAETAYLRGQEANQYATADPIPAQQLRWAQGIKLQKRARQLKDAEIVIYYQPQVLPGTGKTVGCEALIRLALPTGEILSPLDFLDDLNQANLSHELDLWVVTKVCEQMRDWTQAPQSSLVVSINITASTLTMPVIVDKIARRVSRYPGRIVLEITEQAIVGQGAQSELALHTLRAAGAHIHLDDFGTGYSSLAYLCRLPIDGIKIDRSFVRMLDDKRGRTLLQSLCKLAKDLELDVIVEGIETEWQLSHLPTDLAILVQGWYYAAAQPPEQLLDYLTSRAVAPASVCATQPAQALYKKTGKH